MVEIRVFCDRCAERVTSDRAELRTRCGPLRLKRPTIDLCDRCQTWLHNALTAYPRQSKAPADPEPAAAG